MPHMRDLITQARIETLRTSSEFTLTEDHRKLLRRMRLQWQWCETGAPEVDPKRPYGNSNVYVDVAEILGWEMPPEDATDLEYERWADGMRARAAKIHAETLLAMQVLLSTGRDTPGRYVRRGRWCPWETA
jgi:hypothetical protein